MGELQKNLSERFKMASERLKKFRGTFPKTALFNRIMTHSPSPSTLPKRRIFGKSGSGVGEKLGRLNCILGEALIGLKWGLKCKIKILF